MQFTIKSTKLGKDVTFFTGNGTSYVFVDLNGQPGTLGNQICYGGGLSGSTISYGLKSRVSFETICRRWWNAYLKRQRNI